MIEDSLVKKIIREPVYHPFEQIRRGTFTIKEDVGRTLLDIEKIGGSIIRLQEGILGKLERDGSYEEKINARFKRGALLNVYIVNSFALAAGFYYGDNYIKIFGTLGLLIGINTHLLHSLYAHDRKLYDKLK